MNSNENAHDPLVEQALVGFDLAAEHHIAHCEPCQTEREKVAEALCRFGAANREYANRPNSFWEQQAESIRAAQQASVRRSRATLALVPSVVVLLLLGFAVLGRAPGVRPVAVAPPLAQTDSDHELLVGVERAMGRRTPLALEPATLMVEESSGNEPLNSTDESKERRSHEN
ncbi:MAG: hypothetical protein DMG82_01485 [Acidobacteria bacterium]|nr:MAG: hypothetical protein DMG82_01485 [Acidobacteriota bacterium]